MNPIKQPQILLPSLLPRNILTSLGSNSGFYGFDDSRELALEGGFGDGECVGEEKDTD